MLSQYVPTWFFERYPRIQATMLVLEELIAPTLEQWQRDDKYVYISRLLQDGKDAGLITLAEFFLLREKFAQEVL